ncbi:MAG: D-alanyl-D-alanine carboxypeptidase family protein, partial [Oscillospiraceae bacterium]
MKKILSTISLITVIITQAVLSYAAPPQLSSIVSDSYVIMNSDTGQILVEKNMDKQEFPASITKILTLAIAMENGNLDDKITVCKDCVSGFTSEDANIALTEGEQVTLRDMVYATHLMSANDAANVVAHHTGDSVDEFVDMMNEKAKDIGCENTHFTNANGMPDNNHYTTAKDMALITKYALSVPQFKKVFSETAYTMPPTNKQDEQRLFGTYHYMVVNSAYNYKYATGGKLGWTKPAGHTIVTTASKNGLNLICVAMKTSQKYDKYKDSIALFDYCFDNFHAEKINGSTLKANEVPVFNGEKVMFKLNPTFDNNYTIYLHNNYTKADVEISSNLKSSYTIEDEIKPEIIFKLKDCQGEMYDGNFAVPLAYDGNKDAGSSI